MLKIEDFMTMLIGGADRIIAAKDELTDIDSRFGDADHGITMEKLMESVKHSIMSSGGSESFKKILEYSSKGVMMINGGSAVPLWSTLFDGMSQAAPDKGEIDLSELKLIFSGGCHALSALSTAKVGDKTMMDALIPAVSAISAAEGDIKAIMEAGAKSAADGAEATKDFISKFGRAKSYREQTLGTPDAGATSMKYFFVGMSEALEAANIKSD
jgi:phosphoenolpyruvate---glycerone phosphotransferase subunit DhaL